MKTKFILAPAYADEINYAIADYRRVMPGRYVFEPAFADETYSGLISFYASSQEIKSLIRCLTYHGSTCFFSKALVCELVDQLIDSYSYQPNSVDHE